MNKRLTTSTDRSRLFGPTSSRATSPLRCFSYTSKLGGLGVGSAVQRHAVAPWRAWQSIIPTLMATTQSPDTDSLFFATPLRASSTSTTPDHPFPTNEQTCLPTQTTWSSHSPQKPPKRNKSPPFKETSTSNSTTAPPTHLLNKPSSYHNPLTHFCAPHAAEQ